MKEWIKVQPKTKLLNHMFICVIYGNMDDVLLTGTKYSKTALNKATYYMSEGLMCSPCPALNK